MTLNEAVSAADLVLLTVPDDAIAPVAASLPWRAGQFAVHCSGATELEALAAAHSAGALIGGFHPLQIFSDPERAASLLQGCSVAIEAESPLLDALLALAQTLGLRPLSLPPGVRAAYHGSANFAASFLLSMLDEVLQVWVQIGLLEPDNRENALQALLPMAQATLAAAGSKGLAGAQAGALSRGDVGVIERHLAALDVLGGEHGRFYREFSRRQLSLAQASGRLDEATLLRLKSALEG